MEGRLNDEFEAADVTGRFLSPFDRPTDLHEGGNRNRRVEYLEIAANERGGLERAGTKNADTAVAQIVQPTVKFLGALGLGTRRWPGSETSCMHFEHLRKPHVLTPFTIGEVAHGLTSCPKLPLP